MTAARGPGTRVVRAGLPEPADGEPLLPGPTFAAPYHLAGETSASPYGYGRTANPTWTRLEAALGELEGGEAVVFASGMAAATAVVLATLGPGDVLVAPGDGYPGVRWLGADLLGPRGVQVRLVASRDDAFAAAMPGATLVWVESPSNPGLERLDLAGLARAAHETGAALAVDGTLAGPLAQRPLELGADLSMTSASKQLTGHADLVLGYVAARDPDRVAALRRWRTQTGSVPGPFEAWLAHRSLPTLAVRAERQAATAEALAAALRARGDVTGVRWPGVGTVVGFDLGSARRAQGFLAASELVDEATSFGGVHTTAERRARWGTDDVPPGYVRMSVGLEDAADLLADVGRALDLTRS